MEATVRKFDELAVNLFDASMFFSKEKFVDFRSDFEHSCHFYGPFSNKGQSSYNFMMSPQDDRDKEDRFSVVLEVIFNRKTIKLHLLDPDGQLCAPVITVADGKIIEDEFLLVNT